MTVERLCAAMRRFSPLLKPDATRWLIPPALAALAAGLFLLPRA